MLSMRSTFLGERLSCRLALNVAESMQFRDMLSANMKTVRVFLLLVVAIALTGLAEGRTRSSGPRYSGSHHTTSHGGRYAGGRGSSHKGGHYRNSHTGNHYGHHKP